MPDASQYETSAAVHELLTALQSVDARFFEGRTRSATTSRCSRATSGSSRSCRSRSTRRCGPTPRNPRFVDIVGPYKKWGGDNADAYYQSRADRPGTHLPRHAVTRRRRVPLAHRLRRAARRPLLGAHRRHASTTATIDIGARRHVRVHDARASDPTAGTGRSSQLEDDAVVAITRDYLDRPGARDARASGTSSRSTRPRPTARTTPTSPAASAPRSRGCATSRRWCRSRSASRTRSTSRTRCQQVTFGWAAGDAAYAMGSFDLADDEALVIRGRSPECAFWNLCLWNPFLHTYNYDYEQVTINGGQVAVRARRLVDDRRRAPRPRPPELGVDRRATRAAASGSAGSYPDGHARRPTDRGREARIEPRSATISDSRA